MKRLFVFCLALMGAVSMLGAASEYDQRALEELIGKKKAAYNDYNDNSPFSIDYTGAGTAAALTIQTSTLTLTITGSGQGAVAGIFLDTGDYDTFGEVYNFLRSTGYYTVTLKDCRRAEDSIYLGDVTSQSVLTSYDVLLDTGPAHASSALGDAGLGCFIALNNPTPSTSMSAGNKKSTKRIRLFKAIVQGDTGGGTTDPVRIYVEDSSAGWAETKIWDEAIVDNTDKTVSFTSNDPYGGYDFDEGDRIIIQTWCSEIQTAGSDIQAYWLEW